MTRSKRTTTTTTHTTLRSSSASSARRTSPRQEDLVEEEEFNSSNPTSPYARTRAEEKDELALLNNRLADYIDKMRQLEHENNRLSIQIKDIETVEKRDKNNIRESYEAELADARRLLDETAKDKARIQIDADKARGAHDDLRAKISKLEADLKASDKARLAADSLVQDLQARYNTADNNRKYHEDECKKLRAELDRTQRQSDGARKQLEDETILRVDLENRLQTLKEQRAFEKQLYEKEVADIKRKRETEVTAVGKQLEGEFKAKLQEQLKQMRAQLDDQMTYNRREVEVMYEDKIKGMQESSEKALQAAARAREELSVYRSKFEKADKERNASRSQLEALERQIKDLQDQLDQAKDDYYNRLILKDEDIRALRDDINRMMTEYQDLLDVKVKLDVEIEAYRSLLQSEEERLKLTPRGGKGGSTSSTKKTVTVSESGGGSTGRLSLRGGPGPKRKRIEVEESSERDFYLPDQQAQYKENSESFCELEVSEHDPDGKFVTITNTSPMDLPVGGWSVKQSAENEGEITYKFHGRQIIKGNDYIKIWGSSGEANPPREVRMKTHESWPHGDSFKTTLYDSSGEVAAWRESIRKNTSGFLAGAGAEDEADQRCSIM